MEPVWPEGFLRAPSAFLLGLCMLSPHQSYLLSPIFCLFVSSLSLILSCGSQGNAKSVLCVSSTKQPHITLVLLNFGTEGKGGGKMERQLK